MNVRRRSASFCLGASLSSALLFLCPAVRADLSDAQKEAYAGLRRDFFVVLALPLQAENRPRKEHIRYFRQVTAFIESLGDEQLGYRAAAWYFRGRLLMILRRRPLAREDFDAAITILLEKPKSEDVIYPPGLPTVNAIRILRAFTFVDQGPEIVLKEMEAIPDEAEMPMIHEVGSLLAGWADRLAGTDNKDLAIRAYQVIQRFRLWDDEQDDPQRKIDLLKLQSQGGMGFQQIP